MATRRKTDAVDVPQSEAAAHQLFDDIGKADRRVEFLTTRRDAKVAAIKTEYGNSIAEINAAADVNYNALSAYFQANAAALLPKDRESVEWPEGKLGFRMTPFALKVAKAEAAAVLAALAAHDEKLIRVTREIDKPEVLKRFDGLPVIDGLTRSRRKEFFAKPAGLETERKKVIPAPKVKKAKPLKKAKPQ